MQLVKSIPVPRVQTAAPKVQLSGVGKTYDGKSEAKQVEVLQNIDIAVADGEFVSIVGPSGCGKSTILKMISGLVCPSHGNITVDSRAVIGPPAGVGFLFQRDALLPWGTVEENICIGLDLGKCAREDRSRRLNELIRLVGLEGFEKFYPNSLSGGMRHRVSLARTLAYNPSLFLMDEPFGALDAHTKIILGHEFLRIWSEYRRTVLFVTHDISEAIAMSDRVIVMSNRPGTIVAEFDITLSRPRDFVAVRGMDLFLKLYQEVWAALMNDANRGAKLAAKTDSI